MDKDCECRSVGVTCTLPIYPSMEFHCALRDSGGAVSAAGRITTGEPCCGSCNSSSLPSLEALLALSHAWGSWQSPGIPWHCSSQAEFSSCVHLLLPGEGFSLVGWEVWENLPGRAVASLMEGHWEWVADTCCQHCPLLTRCFWGAQSSSSAMSSSFWKRLGSPVPSDWPGNGPGACGTLG